MLLQLAITLLHCELPLGLTIANLDQETPYLITFPAMDHLLRMWKVTHPILLCLKTSEHTQVFASLISALTTSIQQK